MYCFVMQMHTDALCKHESALYYGRILWRTVIPAKKNIVLLKQWNTWSIVLHGTCVITRDSGLKCAEVISDLGYSTWDAVKWPNLSKGECSANLESQDLLGCFHVDTQVMRKCRSQIIGLISGCNAFILKLFYPLLCLFSLLSLQSGLPSLNLSFLPSLFLYFPACD